MPCGCIAATRIPRDRGHTSEVCLRARTPAGVAFNSSPHPGLRPRWDRNWPGVHRSRNSSRYGRSGPTHSFARRRLYPRSGDRGWHHYAHFRPVRRKSRVDGDSLTQSLTLSMVALPDQRHVLHSFAGRGRDRKACGRGQAREPSESRHGRWNSQGVWGSVAVISSLAAAKTVFTGRSIM